MERKTLPDDREFKGEYKDGKREGFGITFFGDGSRFEGDFENDEANGKGIYVFDENQKYEW